MKSFRKYVYIGLPILGTLFYLYYLHIATIDMIYSDYILPEVPRGRFDVSVNILLTEKGVRVTKDSKKTHPGKG